MKTVRGRITVTQESRFQLVDDQGRTMLFALAHGAPIEPQQLLHLRERACPVEVHYEETATLNDHAVQSLYALDPPDTPADNL